MLLATDDASLLNPLWLGPLVTALAALAALIGVLVTVRQRTKADKRDQWWKRAQWAFDLTLDEVPHRQAVGLRGLQYLVQSELAGEDEIGFIEIAWVEPLAEAADSNDTGDDDGEGDLTT